MKKATYTVIFLLVGVISLSACKKVYHCTCTYNNTIVYRADIGSQYQNNAQNQCNNYDTTVKGEAWNCTIY